VIALNPEIAHSKWFLASPLLEYSKLGMRGTDLAI